MKQGSLLLGIFFAVITTAGAWDPIGHMIVNQQAYNQLTPAAKAKVDESIAAFNQKQHATYTFFVTAGCWMDDIRGKTKEFNTWHYINLPVHAGRAAAAGGVGAECAVGHQYVPGYFERRKNVPRHRQGPGAGHAHASRR